MKEILAETIKWLSQGQAVAWATVVSNSGSTLIKGGLGGVGFISPVSDHFCHQCNRLRLTPEGHLRTCLFGDQEKDLSALLRKGAADQELAEVIQSALESKRPHIAEAGERGSARPMFNIGG